MAWREKVAWLTLLCMVVAYSVYFGLTAMAPRSTLQQLLLFGQVTIVQGIVVIIASITLSLMAGKEARAKPDERDRAIGRRGAGIAYFFLMGGIIVVGVVMPFMEQGWRIVNAALLSLVIAEIIRHVVIIWSYRRGWHG
jgi:hypothetical protein